MIFLLDSTTNWSPSNIRNGNLSTTCADDRDDDDDDDNSNRALVFGLYTPIVAGVASRSVKTNLLNLPETKTLVLPDSLVQQTENNAFNAVRNL